MKGIGKMYQTAVIGFAKIHRQKKTWSLPTEGDLL